MPRGRLSAVCRTSWPWTRTRRPRRCNRGPSWPRPACPSERRSRTARRSGPHRRAWSTRYARASGRSSCRVDALRERATETLIQSLCRAVYAGRRTLLVCRAVATRACPREGSSAADAVQRGLQILRVGASEVHPLAATGVLEAEPDRVQPLTFQTELLGQHRVRAIGQVSDAGMVKRGEVNPDLVSTPRLKVDLHERGEPERLNDLVVSDARLAGGYHRELVVVVGVTADRSIDSAVQGIRQALDKGVVRLVDRALLERPLEHGVGVLALGDDHQVVVVKDHSHPRHWFCDDGKSGCRGRIRQRHLEPGTRAHPI